MLLRRVRSVSPNLMQTVAQVVEQLSQGVDLVNGDCTRKNAVSRVLQHLARAAHPPGRRGAHTVPAASCS